MRETRLAARTGGMAVKSNRLPLALAAGALLLALVLVLAAREVRLWNESLTVGDRLFQLSPGPRGLWEPDGWRIGGGVAPTLIGLDDDLRLREAAQLFRRSRPRTGSARTAQMLAVATSAQVDFAEIQDSDAPAHLRSIAANEQGALAFAELQSDPSQAREHAGRATRKFVEAIRLDPANSIARHNLELILTIREEGRGAFAFDEGGGGSNAGAGSSRGGSGF